MEVEHLKVMHDYYDDCHDRESNRQGITVLWALVIFIVIIGIAYIWQKNNNVKLLQSEQLGELKASNSYNRQGILQLDSRIYQDEKFGFWEKPVHCQPVNNCNPCGYGGYPYYGNCGAGYPPYYGNCGWNYSHGYPVPESKFKEVATFVQREHPQVIKTECV